MDCEMLHALLNDRSYCERTEYGHKLLTHCYYPSFERVAVYVSQFGDGFIVTDGGGAASAAFMHGKDDATFAESARRAANRFSLEIEGGVLLARTDTKDWLHAAMLAVANGAAMASAEASEHIALKRETELRTAIKSALLEVVAEHNIASDYAYRGSSGTLWRIDFALLNLNCPILIKAVLPNRNSVTANYAAWGDIAANDDAIRYSAHNRPLKQEDQSLILQVANLVPTTALAKGARQAIG
jgi:hypothetical protein